MTSLIAFLDVWEAMRAIERRLDALPARNGYIRLPDVIPEGVVLIPEYRVVRVRGNALENRIDELARDVGRLRRRFQSNEHAWTGEFLVDAIAGDVEWLDVLTRPTAAERVGDGVDVDDALAAVDARSDELRALLRGDPRRRTAARTRSTTRTKRGRHD